MHQTNRAVTELGMERAGKERKITPIRKDMTELCLVKNRRNAVNHSEKCGCMDVDIMQYPTMSQTDNMETFASEIPPIA